MHTFSLRDLPGQVGELAADAQAGKLSLVTRDGAPVFVAVPFDEALLRGGVGLALAVKLFDEETLSLGQAARLAGLGVLDFMDRLAELRIPVARPRPGELEQELDAFG
jgi:predicted HTH domain antitoxin